MIGFIEINVSNIPKIEEGRHQSTVLYSNVVLINVNGKEFSKFSML